MRLVPLRFSYKILHMFLISSRRVQCPIRLLKLELITQKVPDVETKLIYRFCKKSTLHQTMQPPLISSSAVRFSSRNLFVFSNA